MQYGYVYAGLFALLGILIMVRMGKLNKVFYFAGVVFEIMAAWWLINSLHPELNMFDGVWGWVFRGIMLVTLLVTCYVFYKERAKQPGDDKKQEDKEGEQ